MVELSTAYIWILLKHSIVYLAKDYTKLQSYCIEGKVLNSVSAFLSQHTQVVKVNGEESAVGYVLSGISQGSVLGPILFVTYISDIFERTKSGELLFADDTKIFKHIMSREDALSLQADIDVQYLPFKFNPEKCHVLTLGKFEKY